MKNSLVISLLGGLLLTSCAPQTLYTWNNYSNATYNYVKTKSEADRKKLIATYESIIKSQSGLRKCVPPGIYADYGFLMIEMGQQEKGVALLQKEIDLYPESKPLIERIINQTKK